MLNKIILSYQSGFKKACFTFIETNVKIQKQHKAKRYQYS